MYRKLFLLLALFVFTMTACELQEEMVPSPVAAGAESGSCETGAYRTFDMEYEGALGNYFVVVETGYFQIESCMCKMVSFKLFVSKNGSSQWRLLVGTNSTVPYSWSASETEDILSIDNLKSIYENIGNPGTGKILAQAATNYATLNHADGLCIVDNYDGQGTTVDGGDAAIGTWTNGPIFKIKPGPLPDSYILEAYIPLGMTNPI